MDRKKSLKIGRANIELLIEDGCLRSVGAITVDDIALRNPAAPFRPWFDSYDGDVFDRFELAGIERRGEEVRIGLRARGNPDHPFRERRDCSGDLCFRNQSFDAEPVVAELFIVFKPAAAEIGGRSFTGFSYHFEYASDTCAIHRLLDRATWELGGGSTM